MDFKYLLCFMILPEFYFLIMVTYLFLWRGWNQFKGQSFLQMYLKYLLRFMILQDFYFLIMARQQSSNSQILWEKKIIVAISSTLSCFGISKPITIKTKKQHSHGNFWCFFVEKVRRWLQDWTNLKTDPTNERMKLCEWYIFV